MEIMWAEALPRCDEGDGANGTAEAAFKLKSLLAPRKVDTRPRLLQDAASIGSRGPDSVGFGLKISVGEIFR